MKRKLIKHNQITQASDKTKAHSTQNVVETQTVKIIKGCVCGPFRQSK